ncbi:MAG: hypothetical protein RLZZ426_1020 [Actinomycetota bacterium]|jgi:DNA-binding response OmpR family regulator
MVRVLLVEDDVDISAPLIRALLREDYEISHVINGREAAKASEDCDLVVLDLGLPGMDGLDVCRMIRASGSTIPIIVLSARAEELDLVIGLDAGADDYVTKPFRTSELLARIRATLRRSAVASVLVANKLTIDTATHEVHFGDERIVLTPKEYEVLVLLVRNSPNVVTREHMLRDVWQTDWYGASKTIDMHISTLRKKLEASGANKDLISTVRGVGFRFVRM